MVPMIGQVSANRLKAGLWLMGRDCENVRFWEMLMRLGKSRVLVRCSGGAREVLGRCLGGAGEVLGRCWGGMAWVKCLLLEER